MSKPNFLKHEIVFNPTGNEFDKARDQLLGTYKLVKVEDWEYKFIKQPKLSIPKKIADMLDEELKDSEDKLYTFNKGYEDMVLPYELLLQKNYASICAYLAGKALGVELVEVTDE
ncbi:hypothetical protein NH621_04450 [Lactococcus formosensis]|uniref:hypothetical protein n=1 Tax=Lactococcus formosensis TaxID=1281486 RepID=UPI0020984960|nr:hypothetical protein [Lactococcus formosensis]MCO7180433.1 hypothetical protein [Lactococcus formosensis]